MITAHFTPMVVPIIGVPGKSQMTHYPGLVNVDGKILSQRILFIFIMGVVLALGTLCEEEASLLTGVSGVKYR